MDDYSRGIAGYFLSFDAPNAQNTALTLHQAIWNKSDTRWPICGIPEKFYTDHGSDFTSHHMEQVAVDLKINLLFSKSWRATSVSFGVIWHKFCSLNGTKQVDNKCFTYTRISVTNSHVFIFSAIITKFFKSTILFRFNKNFISHFYTSLVLTF